MIKGEMRGTGRFPGYPNQSLDRGTQRKIEELGNMIRYVQVLRRNKKAVFNIEDLDVWLARCGQVMCDVEAGIEETIDRRLPIGLYPYRYPKLVYVAAIARMSKAATRLLDESKIALRGFKRSTNQEIGARELVSSKEREAYQELRHKIMDRACAGIIKVSGRPGVGKTPVVSKINDYFLDEATPRRFKKVFWVSTMPDDATVTGLQREIANQMNIPAATDEERAQLLLQELSGQLEVLFILDLWKEFTLEQIGIPPPTQENGHKVVMICRRLEVGRSYSEREGEVADLEMTGLSQQQTTSLFSEMVGEEHIKKLPEETYRMLLDECDGLPSLINRLGRDIKKQLENDRPVNITDHTGQYISASLQDSYRSLIQKAQDLFLYCALFPSQPNALTETEDLIRCCVCDGLMDRAAPTAEADELLKWMNELVEQGKEMLDEIKNTYLLETVHRAESNTEYIKMSWSVRNMAAHVRGRSFFIKVGSAKPEPSEEVERASVMSDQLEQLGTQHVKRLSTLVVRYQHQHEEFEFPPRLFRDMPNLKVLDLSGTHIESFPLTFQGLRELRALRLCGCPKLTSLPDMSSFLQLLVLDLSDTRITYLPRGLCKLKKLMCLNLSGTRMKHFPFPDGLLSKLAGLQELLMMSSYLWTGNESQQDRKRVTELARFEANLYSLQALRKFTEGQGGSWPSGFRLCVGKFHLHQKVGKNTVAVLIEDIPADVQGSLVLLPSNNVLHLMFNNNLDSFPRQVNIAGLRHLTAVNISDCGGLLCLFKADMLRPIPNLRKITVRRCAKMVVLIEGSGEASLGNVEELAFFQLEQLQRVFDGVIQCGYLRSISVWECDQFRTLPVTRGRDNDAIEVCVDNEQFTDREMYTIKVLKAPATAPDDLSSKPTYTNPNVTDEDKPSMVTIIRLTLCFIIMLYLVSISTC